MKNIHFEQFVEEIRLHFPDAQNIWATESPLTILIDGQPVDPGALLENHHPIWIEANPERIRADGEEASLLAIYAPDFAGDELTIHLQHGSTHQTETVRLDADGKAELELSSQTAGGVVVSAAGQPVRTRITVVPFQEL